MVTVRYLTLYSMAAEMIYQTQDFITQVCLAHGNGKKMVQ